MRKILSSRIFRILVCLALICCLLVNASPIKAEATGLVEGIAVAPLPVSVKVVAAAALICLGIMVASESTAFNNAVDNFANFLSETTSYVVDGMVNVFGVVGSDGLVRSYLPQELLETGLGWAFDSGTIVESSPSVFNEFYFPVTYTTFSFDSPVYIVSHYISQVNLQGQISYSFKYWALSSVPFTWRRDGYSQTYPSVEISGVYLASIASGGGGSMTLVPGVHYVDYGCVDDILQSSYMTDEPGFPSSDLIASDGLTLGRIQAPVEGVAFGDLEAYSAYAGGAISLPGITDDEEKLHLPVRIPGLEYNDDVITQTQEEAQTGVTDLEFVFTGDDTVTDDTITDSGSITWQPPSDMGKFTLDLKQYFPFCIPFDLYAFFTCLNAEPVAPVIEWIIPLPGGKTYPFEIDLSAFDSVAQILRRMQLLLFCVGLAFKTRDLIKG